MPKLSEQEVRHIAGLARIGVSDEEVSFYTRELSSVLAYVEQLNEIATTEVVPLSHATGAHSVTRSDGVQLWEDRAWKDILLACVSSVERGFVKVKAILDKTNG
jgi:aspartyl-tRNA(Asn)/glutamyl-tRNA(Gln) amidotransferase subunit C